MKYLIILLAVFLFHQDAKSQTRNNVSLYFDNYHYFNVRSQTEPIYKFSGGNFTPVIFPGISYSRSIGKQFQIAARYSSWWRGGSGRGTLEENSNFDTASVCKIYSRYRYQFLDVEAAFVYPFYKQHHLRLSAGPSWTHGEDYYLTDLTLAPNGHVIYADYESRMKSHWGIVWGCAYDYKFTKAKINLGLDLRWRYVDDVPFSYNYGLHAGYNF